MYTYIFDDFDKTIYLSIKMCKHVYMERKKSLRFRRKQLRQSQKMALRLGQDPSFRITLSAILNIICGVASFASLVFLLVEIQEALSTLKKVDAPDGYANYLESTTRITSSLGYSVIGLLLLLSVLFVVFSYITSKQGGALATLPIEKDMLEKRVLYHQTLFHTFSESNHTIVHFYRYLMIKNKVFREDIKSDGSVSLEACAAYVNDLHNNLITITTNMASAFTILTKTTCAVTIKQHEGGYVKTLFRDAGSYRKRKTHDFEDGKVRTYNIKDNTAFRLIANKQRQVYCCDALAIERNNGNYDNVHSDFDRHYDATLVVPIESRPHKTYQKHEYNLIGFLCIDNLGGGFDNDESIELLSSYGDLLYSVLAEAHEIMGIIKKNGAGDAFVKRWTDWS